MFRTLSAILTISLLLTIFFLFINVPFSMVDDMVLYDNDLPKDFFATYILILLILFFLYKIDKAINAKYPWSRTFLQQRLFYQFVLGIIIPAVFIWFYIYAYRTFVLRMKPLAMEQFTSSDYPVAILVIIFLNICLVGIHFYRLNKQNRRKIELLKAELFTLKEITATPGKEHLKSMTPHAPDSIDNQPSQTEIIVPSKKNKRCHSDCRQ